MGDAFALMIVLAVLALAINGLISLFERRFLPGQSSGRERTSVSL
jgi:hypothetical protein